MASRGHICDSVQTLKMNATYYQTMALSDLPRSERPREKLLASGPSILTDAELLAILIRTGIKGRSALQIAHDIIEPVSYTHLRAHETSLHLVCRLLLEKKKG